jgi:hypothetical protein
MRVPVTKKYLDMLRERLIKAENEGRDTQASMARDEYRKACAHAYSVGDLVFKEKA